MLWNPVLKKEYKNLPEERIRLQFVDYLLEEVGFSKHRISFETPVNLPRDKSSSRTDLICYDDSFKPLLLVECKAADVKLEAKAALQIARYNQEVNAPFLLVTNGLQSFWFANDPPELNYLEEIPAPFSSKTNYEMLFGYWSERGFLGAKSHPDIQGWLVESCSELYLNASDPPSYLSFSGSEPDLLLANYYSISELNTSTKLALSLSSTPHGVTKFIGILNVDGENRALLHTSLDLIVSREPANTMVQSGSVNRTIDLKEEIGFNFENPIIDYTSELVKIMSYLP